VKLWVVEDEANLARGLARGFREKGYETEIFPSLAELGEGLADSEPEVVFLDVRLPDGDGLSALPHILKSSPMARVIVMTAFGESSLVVRAIKEGAYNYLDKPFPLEAAFNMASRASEAISLARRVRRLEKGKKVSLAGSSQVMMRVRDFVRKVSPHREVNVLLQGESGSGKEVVARMIGESGSSCGGEFVAINCSAIPENLLEAELFGYRKGAYTGASSNKTGLIQMADGGTLFLDEIGDMPLLLQQKMLRFLDSRTIRPLGSEKEYRVTLKVICATCVDLENRIAEGRFRDDLYYRISTLPLRLPPLRERGGDVLELSVVFLAMLASKMARPPLTLGSEVEQVFLSYAWPGNVRELKNLLERIYILKEPSDTVIRLYDLPSEMLDDLPDKDGVGGKKAQNVSLQEHLDTVERDLIRRALEKTGGNRTRAAGDLGMSRYALLRRMQRHGMDAERKDARNDA